MELWGWWVCHGTRTAIADVCHIRVISNLQRDSRRWYVASNFSDPVISNRQLTTFFKAALITQCTDRRHKCGSCIQTAPVRGPRAHFTERAMAPVPLPWPGVRFSRAEETSECSGLLCSAPAHRVALASAKTTWISPRKCCLPTRCVNARGLHRRPAPAVRPCGCWAWTKSCSCWGQAQICRCVSSLRCLSSAWAESWRGSDHGGRSSLHKASSSYPLSSYSLVHILGWGNTLYLQGKLSSSVAIDQRKRLSGGKKRGTIFYAGNASLSLGTQ